jgi:hypothetical protein
LSFPVLHRYSVQHVTTFIIIIFNRSGKDIMLSFDITCQLPSDAVESFPPWAAVSVSVDKSNKSIIIRSVAIVALVPIPSRSALDYLY